MLHHRPDVDRMLSEMSSYEVTEWAAYLELLQAEREAEEEKRKQGRGKPGKPSEKPVSADMLKHLPKGTLGLDQLGM